MCYYLCIDDMIGSKSLWQTSKARKISIDNVMAHNTATVLKELSNRFQSLSNIVSRVTTPTVVTRTNNSVIPRYTRCIIILPLQINNCLASNVRYIPFVHFRSQKG